MENKFTCNCGEKCDIEDIHSVLSYNEVTTIDFCEKCWITAPVNKLIDKECGYGFTSKEDEDSFINNLVKVKVFIIDDIEKLTISAINNGWGKLKKHQITAINLMPVNEIITFPMDNNNSWDIKRLV